MTRLRSAVRSILRSVGLNHPMRDLLRDYRFARKSRPEMAKWHSEGKPSPPPECIKHACIRNYARKYGTRVMVETGTWKGDTTFAMRKIFREIHSIELARDLYVEAREQFAHLPQVHCHFGDSAHVLPIICNSLKEPILFWLDGHYCAGRSARGELDTPISEELRFLLQRPRPRDVVLIDDARFFVGMDGYPTIQTLQQLINLKWPQAHFSVEQDIIRIVGSR